MLPRPAMRVWSSRKALMGARTPSRARARPSAKPLPHTAVISRRRSAGARPRTIVSTSGSSGTRAPRGLERVGEAREVGDRQALGAQRLVDARVGERARDDGLAEGRL